VIPPSFAVLAASLRPAFSNLYFLSGILGFMTDKSTVAFRFSREIHSGSYKFETGDRLSRFKIGPRSIYFD